MNRKAENGRRSAGRPPYSTGFTLLEALIAVSIMALIVSGIYASFFTAGRNVEQAEKARDTADLARTLVMKLSDDIANAYFNPGMKAPTVFYGKKEENEKTDQVRRDGIYLTTLTNWRRAGTAETDLWEVGYFFREKPDGTGWVLYRSEKREPAEDVPVLEGGEEYELTDRVAGLQYRYSNGLTWSDEWDTRKQAVLPKEVELTLALLSGPTFTTRVVVGRQ